MSPESIIAYLFYILLPILALYIGYLVVTKAFNEMGFSSVEAIIIVFVSFITGAGIIDGFLGINFSNIVLFTYGQYWIVGINFGGAIIPIILSSYLALKNKIKPINILFGVTIVAIITYFVTEPVANKGIVSKFPYWLLPVFFASIASIIIYWKGKKNKAAPLAYISGTIGVLIGADLFHLITLLNYEIGTKRNATIGGANIFDMVFITGILAVILDGIIIIQEKKKN